MRDKILALGASSSIGRRFILRYSADEIVFTYNNNKLKGGIHFNSLTMGLDEIIENPEDFHTAVIFFGDTKPVSCFQSPELSNNLNVDSIIRVLAYLKQWEVKPIFISTEFVFDGTKGNYNETDKANPVVLYGMQKLLIEEFIQSKFSEFLIFRLAKTYGLEKNDNTIFSNWMEHFKIHQSVLCASDQRFSPIFIDDVVEVLYQCSKHKYTGLYNLGGAKPYTRLSLLELLLKERKKYVDEEINVTLCAFNSFDLGEKWPVDVSLDVRELMKRVNIAWTTPKSACKKIVKLYLGQDYNEYKSN